MDEENRGMQKQGLISSAVAKSLDFSLIPNGFLNNPYPFENRFESTFRNEARTVGLSVESSRQERLSQVHSNFEVEIPIPWN